MKPHLIFYDANGAKTTYTYEKMNKLGCRAAHALSSLGLQKGDTVAVLSRNSPHYAIAWFACAKMGAILTGINYMFTEEEIAYQANHCEARFLIVEAGLASKVDRIRQRLPHVEKYICCNVADGESPAGWIDFRDLVAEGHSDLEPEVEIHDDDVAFLTYTSGTEAKPKGALIQHRTYYSSTVLSWLIDFGLSNDDIALFVLPLYTIGGLGTFTLMSIIGMTIVLPYQVDPSQCLGIVQDEGVSFIAQTPTFYLRLMQGPNFEDADLSTVRLCGTFGGLLSVQVLDAWNRKAPDIVWTSYWGQSELGQLGCLGKFRTLEDVPGGDPSWIGKPVATLEVRVVDEKGEEVAVGEPGELVCRSPSTMLGYHKDPEKTESVFAGGWVHTGDIVRQDGEGNLFFFDRKKDVIKTGGINVSSYDVEQAIHRHPGVAEVAVVGVQDQTWSEIVTAAVVPQKAVRLSEKEIEETCRASLAAYKVPKEIILVEQLPKDPSGKILKRELRKQIGEQRRGQS
jgi:acyl-CoA synthetase (AMP-forming)/AMP-acid ligase II